MHFFNGLAISALIIATLGVAPLQAQDLFAERQAYQEALTTLGEPVQHFCIANMRRVLREHGRDPAAITLQATVFLADTEMMQQSYLADYDTTAATDLLERFVAAVNATNEPEQFSSIIDLLSPAVFETGFPRDYERFGQSPESIVDVTSFYLVLLWTAQTADLQPIGNNRTFAAVREQLAVAETRCPVLGALGEGLAARRELLMLRSMFLSDGLEAALREGEEQAFADFVQDRFGSELHGLELTDYGFRYFETAN